MFAVTKIATFVVAAFGLAGTVAAAPVHDATSNALVARGPYDTHNGWVRSYSYMQSCSVSDLVFRHRTVCIDLVMIERRLITD
jgi:hypothetical protein